MRKPAIKKAKTEGEMEAWKEGFESGARTTEIRNEKELQIGRALMQVLYNTFETKREDY